MTTPIHLDTAARALDALPPAEAGEFDAHVAGCDTCATEYREFLATTAMLAAAVAEPPPDRLREKVLRAAAVTPQLPPLHGSPAAEPVPAPAGTDDSVPPHTNGRQGRAVPWWRRPMMLAAVAVVAVVIAGGVVWVTRPAGPTPEQAAAQCVAAAADAQVKQPKVGSGGSVTLARSCDAAIVRAPAMPELPSDRTYQLWVMAGSAARSVGLAQQAKSPEQFVVTGITASDTDIGFSVEPAGGSRAPTTAPIWVVALK